MAANNFIQLRRADWRDFSDPDIGEIIKQLRNAPYDPWIWEFMLSQEAPDAAAEPYVDFTDEFNGETTAAVLYVKGAHAQDKAAGTGAQVIRCFGIIESGDPGYEDITMHATAATEIAGTVKFVRYVGSLVIQAGSGGVNAGAIQISNTGQAAVYGTIATGENATIGARVYVPENYNAFIGSFRAGVINASHATDELPFGDGIIITPTYSTSPSVDNVDSYWVDNVKSMANLNVIKHLITGADTRYITFSHVTKADDANATGIYNIKIIMYGTTNTLRGLGA